MSTELRVITGADWEAFRAVRLRALADSPDSFGATLEESASQESSLWRERAGGPGPVVLAFADDSTVGMGGLYTPDETGDVFVWGMWVEPAWRGRGLASDILRLLLDQPAAQARPALLHVTQGNDTARRLYERHGFVGTGETLPLRPGSTVLIDALRRV
ncbi:GNAT family N-acetyltransferase [Terrabacter lapilli]|uniref:GNAT family N-acetyltransferase n=1 Tax=Terrabacter lapilli TaxID=436231 RepID=A0ABN2RWM8_9MICO